MIKNNLDPIWAPATIPVFVLCNGNYHGELRIQVYDQDKDDISELIGQVESTLHALTDRVGHPLSLTHPTKRKSKKTAPWGSVILKDLEFKRHSTFFEYLRGGCELNLMVAIDYTASNKAPMQPDRYVVKYLENGGS